MVNVETEKEAVIIKPPAGLNYEFAGTFLPAEIILILTRLKQEGIPFEFIDFELKYGNSYSPDTSIDELLNDIPLNASHYFIGTSMANYFIATEIARGLKNNNPGALVAMGAYHVSNIPKLVLESQSSVDLVIRGQAVDTVPKVMKTEDLESVTDIAFRQGEKIILTRKTHKDVNTFPLPDWDLVPVDSYFENAKKRPMDEKNPYQILTFSQIGCGGKCTFCGIYDKKVSTMTPENWARSISQIDQRFGLDNVMLNDGAPYFPVGMKWTEKVLEILDKQYKLAGKGQVQSYSKVKDINPERLDIISDTYEIFRFFFGIESLSKRALKQIKKESTVDDLFKVLEMIDNYPNIYFCGSVMINLAGETLGELEQTLKLAEELRSSPKCQGIFVFENTLLQGSQDYYKFCKETGIKPTDTLDSYVIQAQREIWRRAFTHLNEDDLKEARKFTKEPVDGVDYSRYTGVLKEWKDPQKAQKRINSIELAGKSHYDEIIGFLRMNNHMLEPPIERFPNGIIGVVKELLNSGRIYVPYDEHGEIGGFIGINGYKPDARIVFHIPPLDTSLYRYLLNKAVTELLEDGFKFLEFYGPVDSDLYDLFAKHIATEENGRGMMSKKYRISIKRALDHLNNPWEFTDDKDAVIKYIKEKEHLLTVPVSEDKRMFPDGIEGAVKLWDKNGKIAVARANNQVIGICGYTKGIPIYKDGKYSLDHKDFSHIGLMLINGKYQRKLMRAAFSRVFTQMYIDGTPFLSFYFRGDNPDKTFFRFADEQNLIFKDKGVQVHHCLSSLKNISKRYIAQQR